jgi:hypothetical protein
MRLLARLSLGRHQYDDENDSQNREGNRTQQDTGHSDSYDASADDFFNGVIETRGRM